jgi:hypothetical protein
MVENVQLSSKIYVAYFKLRTLGEGGEVFFDEVANVGAAEDFDEADFFGSVEIDDEMALDRLKLDDVGDLDLGGGREARAVVVAAIADRFEPRGADLCFERLGAGALEEVDDLLDEVGEDGA